MSDHASTGGVEVPGDPAGSSDSGKDAGRVRAGAAVAARRRQLGISQRSLAADGVITAAALIAFEKGRSWPRDSTRRKLETVLEWEPGSIDRIRRGEAPDGPSPQAALGAEPSLLVAALASAASALTSVIEALPATDAQEFAARATSVLADLRQLESVASKAARVGPATPELLKALAVTRRQYDELMLAAARSPGATLGQRVYAVRRLNTLTDAELAQASGISETVIVKAQAEQPLTATEAAALETAVAQFNWT